MNALSDDLAFASIGDVAALLRSGEITSRELVDLMLDRIERLNPDLNCYISVSADAAREQADGMDALRRAGVDLGVLHGVPVAHKDNIFTRTANTTAASPVFADFRPSYDAPVVESCARAGAIVLGKLNLYELAAGGVTDRFGEARNPWRSDLSAGLSSNGSGSAVASGLAFAATGTDTGGSVRIPAAACGVVGLKPTLGAISTHGVFPVSQELDHVGVLARDVESTAAFFAAARTRPGDDAPDPAQCLDGRADGIRVARARRQPGELLSSEIDECVTGALHALGERGATTGEADLPRYDYALQACMIIWTAEASENYREYMSSRFFDFSQGVRQTLLMGRRTPAADYLRAQRVRSALTAHMRELFGTVDVIVLPTLPAPVWHRDALSASVEGVEESLMSAWIRYSTLANLSGFPAISLPAGFTTDGAPLAVQMMARPGEESLLLRAAHAYEHSRGEVVQAAPGVTTAA